MGEDVPFERSLYDVPKDRPPACHDDGDAEREWHECFKSLECPEPFADHNDSQHYDEHTSQHDA
jgi:hypothetical protein